MFKATFVELLKKFNTEEFKRLGEFMNSPYFIKREAARNFFEGLRKFYPEFDDPVLEKEEYWKKLYPDKKYNYGTMKNLIFEMNKNIELFISVDSFMKDEKGKFNHLMGHLVGKRHTNTFLSKYKAFETHFKNEELFYTDYYRDFSEIRWKKFLNTILTGKNEDEPDSVEIAELVTLNFIVNFTMSYGGIYNRKSNYNLDHDSMLVDIFIEFLYSEATMKKILEYLETKSRKNYIIIKILFRMMDAFIHSDDKSRILAFKKDLLENSRILSGDAKRNLFAGLNNVIDNSKSSAGLNKRKEAFEIMQALVSENIFEEENGTVQMGLYTLAVKTAALVKQPEFLEMLMKKYTPMLSPELHENAAKFGTAYLHHSRNEFEKSNQYINLINIETFPMKYSLRNLQLINTYEMNEYDSFTFYLDSYKHFLGRNKSVEADYKESNMKFIKYLDRIFKQRQLKTDDELEFLEKEILEDNVVNKYWLLDKIKEITS